MSDKTLTGMAQGQRAGLITPRSLDRNELPVFFHFGRFTEATNQPTKPTQHNTTPVAQLEEHHRRG